MSVLPETDESTRSLPTCGGVEAWQMRPTLLLKGLLDTIGPGAKDTTNCNYCQDEGETTPKISWCLECEVSLSSNCLKAHRQSPSTKHHDVCDKIDEVRVRRRTRVKCQEHTEQFVKFFCRDCMRTLCQSCCILYHRKCESVVSLASMLPEMRSSLETKMDALVNRSRAEEDKLKSFKSRYMELEENISCIKIQIRSTTQRVLDAVKKKDREQLDKLTEVTDKEIDQLKVDIKAEDMACNINKQQADLIDQALNSESENEIYGLYELSESEAAESVGDERNED